MLIFVFGKDTFNAREKVRVIRKAFLDKFDSSGANIAEFPRENEKILEVGGISQAAQAQPFLAQKRMVIVRGLLGEIKRKPDAKPWIEMLKNIPESTIVVLFDQIEAKKIAKHAIFCALKDQDQVHEYSFGSMNQNQAIKWVGGEAKRLDLNISPALCRSFVQMAGVDAWILSVELKKLASFCKGREVTVKDIEIMVRPSADDCMFDLLDALSAGLYQKAWKLLESQRGFGTSDVQLFGMLVRQIRLLISASDYFDQNKGADQKEFAKALGVHPFVAKKLKRQQSHMPTKAFIKIQRALIENDAFVKTGCISLSQSVDRSIAQWSLYH